MQRHVKFSSLGNKVDPKAPYITTKRKVNKIIFHCTASKWGDEFGAKKIDQVHIEKFGKRSGCGYHYIINVDGTVEKGRWSDYPGAHAKGKNRNTLGVAYAGGLDKFGKIMAQGMNEAQYRTAKTLLESLRRGYHLRQDDVLGHNELPYVNKACPCTPMHTLRSYL